MMRQTAACGVNGSAAPIDGAEQALQQTLGTLAEIDAEFQAKVEHLDGLAAPLPEKARLLRQFEDACRRRREPYTDWLAALHSQLRTRAERDQRGQSAQDSRRHVPAIRGQQPVPTPSLN